MNILELLYASEINATVSTFYDNGFTAKLGDPLNGWRAEETFDTWDEVEQWLGAVALIHYPNSAFAPAVAAAAAQEEITRSDATQPSVPG